MQSAAIWALHGISLTFQRPQALIQLIEIMHNH